MFCPTGGDYSKKINCGGPEWEGYQRDPASDSGGDAAAHRRPLWYAEVNEENTTIWAQFEGVDPNVETVEINVRQSIFYPSEPGRNFITVRGFTMRHAATPRAGAMSEQIGLIGTHWSKGWIIENNTISHSMNTGGSDAGTWRSMKAGSSGTPGMDTHHGIRDDFELDLIGRLSCARSRAGDPSGRAGVQEAVCVGGWKAMWKTTKAIQSPISVRSHCPCFLKWACWQEIFQISATEYGSSPDAQPTDQTFIAETRRIGDP